MKKNIGIHQNDYHFKRKNNYIKFNSIVALRHFKIKHIIIISFFVG